MLKSASRLVLAGIAALLLVEGGLRLFALASTMISNPLERSGMLTPGAELISFKEGYGRRSVNELGAFDGPIRRDEGLVARAILLGDSYTEALQVRDEQTFDAVAERALAASVGPVELVNLGRSGDGTLVELDRYLTWADSLKHDFVLVQLNGNDFADNRRVAGSRRNRSAGRAPVPIGLARRLHLELRQHSVLYNKLNLRRDELQTYLAHRNDAEDELAPAPPDSLELAITGKALLDLRDAAEAHGARLLLFEIPDFDAAASEQPSPIAELCEREGLHLLPIGDELREVLQGLPDRKLNGFLNTTLGVGHLNPAGHDALGRLLATHLEQEIGQP